MDFDIFVFAMRIGLTYVLALLPISVLKKDDLRIGMIWTYPPIFAAVRLGGVFLGSLMMLALYLIYHWLRFVGRAEKGVKRALFFLTLACFVLYLVVQTLHLPIRVALRQDQVRISANLMGISWAIAAFATGLEIFFKAKRRRQLQLAVVELDAPS